jgi:YwiC-like protein
MLQPTPSGATPPPTRTLVPHEHGAYGQLAMPLLTALAIGRPGLASAALTLALVTAFVAHESLLVVLGQRGKRALEADAPRARRVLAILGGLGLLAGAVGVAAAPAAARWALLLPATLALVVAWLVLRRLEKTTAGETIVGAALSSGGLAVALAGGAPLAWAIACWVTWVLAFAAATLAVQVVLVRARSKGRRDPGVGHGALAVGLLAGAFGASALGGLPLAAPLALLPTALLSIAVCLARFSPKRLRELGWAMVGSSVLTMVLLVAGLRWPWGRW